MSVCVYSGASENECAGGLDGMWACVKGLAGARRDWQADFALHKQWSWTHCILVNKHIDTHLAVLSDNGFTMAFSFKSRTQDPKANGSKTPHSTPDTHTDTLSGL